MLNHTVQRGTTFKMQQYRPSQSLGAARHTAPGGGGPAARHMAFSQATLFGAAVVGITVTADNKLLVVGSQIPGRSLTFGLSRDGGVIDFIWSEARLTREVLPVAVQNQVGPGFQVISAPVVTRVPLADAGNPLRLEPGTAPEAPTLNGNYFYACWDLKRRDFALNIA